MKIYYNDAPDVRMIIIADGNGGAALHEIPCNVPAEINIPDYIHDHLQTGLFAKILEETEERVHVRTAIQKYHAVRYREESRRGILVLDGDDDAALLEFEEEKAKYKPI